MLTPLPLACVITSGNAFRNPFRAFSHFIAFTTFANAAFSPITIGVTIHSAQTPVLLLFFVATLMPLYVRSCPIPTLTTTVATLLQTACFAATIVYSSPRLFYRFLVATLPLVFVVLATASSTVTGRCPCCLRPCGNANSSC